MKLLGVTPHLTMQTNILKISKRSLLSSFLINLYKVSPFFNNTLSWTLPITHGNLKQRFVMKVGSIVKQPKQREITIQQPNHTNQTHKNKRHKTNKVLNPTKIKG